MYSSLRHTTNFNMRHSANIIATVASLAALGLAAALNDGLDYGNAIIKDPVLTFVMKNHNFGLNTFKCKCGYMKHLI